MELTNLSCETFLAELAGNAPTPGGGGAAALVGAAGAALGNMVGSLTVGKSGVSSGGTVPYTAARMRSQGKNDAAIRTELLKEGYSSGEVARIMRQLNS